MEFGIPVGEQAKSGLGMANELKQIANLLQGSLGWAGFKPKTTIIRYISYQFNQWMLSVEPCWLLLGWLSTISFSLADKWIDLE